MDNTHCDRTSAGQADLGRSAPWKGVISGALDYVAKSALELHRYRYVRTRMLHDSLRKLDNDGCPK